MAGLTSARAPGYSVKLRIEPGGTVKAIYDDALAPVFKALGGPTMTRRVSHVEPCDGGWSADMGPVSGPVLGPFPLRQQALDAEREWLKENLGL